MSYLGRLADIQKRPPVCGGLSLKLGAWRCATLTWGNPTLPSPLLRFTSEFEMDQVVP